MKKHRENRFYRVRMDTARNLRIRLGALILGTLAFFPIAARLVQLTVVDHGYYTAKALNNQTRSTAVLTERGMIYDRNMNVLAVSRSVEHVYLDPQELKQARVDLEQLSLFLGERLGKEPQWILEQAKDTRRRYKQVASGISTETADEIRGYILEKNISGQAR